MATGPSTTPTHPWCGTGAKRRGRSLTGRFGGASSREAVTSPRRRRRARAVARRRGGADGKPRAMAAGGRRRGRVSAGLSAGAALPGHRRPGEGGGSTVRGCLPQGGRGSPHERLGTGPGIPRRGRTGAPARTTAVLGAAGASLAWG